MYRIAIIDEVRKDIERFQLYVHRNDTEKKFAVIPFDPLPSKDELVADLLGSHLDAIVSDYRLNEYKSSVPYNGVDLVNAILERKNSFPCFVLTSFDDNAVMDSDDVNIVYFKGLMTSPPSDAKTTFIQRIENQILKYRTKIKEATRELDVLLSLKNKRPLDPKEEDRFVELNYILDKSIVGEDNIPRAFYSSDTNNRLDSLIQKTEELLSRIRLENKTGNTENQDETN